MSSTISSVFSIFLLFLSMHECEARYMVLVPKGFGAPFHPSSKGLLLVEKFKTLGMDSSKRFVTREDDEAEKVHGGAITSTTTQDTNETKDSKTNHPPPPANEVKYTSRGQKSGVVPATKPLVSVSWPVPRKINRDKNHGKTNPEIYSDYSRPRTWMEHAGSEILESLGHVVGLKATSPTSKKEARRRALAAKEAVNYNSDDKVEDNVVHTDYNPPHSTPPIHNRKT